MFEPTSPHGTWRFSHQYDGGEKSCGELILELRTVFNALPDGAVVRVRTLDPGAPIDLPAWCNVTGHRLLERDHPWYLIGRRPAD